MRAARRPRTALRWRHSRGGILPLASSPAGQWLLPRWLIFLLIVGFFYAVLLRSESQMTPRSTVTSLPSSGALPVQW